MPNTELHADEGLGIDWKASRTTVKTTKEKIPHTLGMNQIGRCDKIYNRGIKFESYVVTRS